MSLINKIKDKYRKVKVKIKRCTLNTKNIFILIKETISAVRLTRKHYKEFKSVYKQDMKYKENTEKTRSEKFNKFVDNGPIVDVNFQEVY